MCKKWKIVKNEKNGKVVPCGLKKFVYFLKYFFSDFKFKLIKNSGKFKIKKMSAKFKNVQNLLFCTVIKTAEKWWYRWIKLKI